MLAPTALRIASIIMAAKAALIGVVYWAAPKSLAAHSISGRIAGSA
jgi:hypothetical protein